MFENIVVYQKKKKKNRIALKTFLFVSSNEYVLVSMEVLSESLQCTEFLDPIEVPIYAFSYLDWSLMLNVLTSCPRYALVSLAERC